jgi:hypothetical protein
MNLKMAKEELLYDRPPVRGRRLLLRNQPLVLFVQHAVLDDMGEYISAGENVDLQTPMDPDSMTFFGKERELEWAMVEHCASVGLEFAVILDVQL